jgi:hypothetical protein
LRADPPLRQAYEVLTEGRVRHLVELVGCMVEAAFRLPESDRAEPLQAATTAGHGFVIPFGGSADMALLQATLTDGR